MQFAQKSDLNWTVAAQNLQVATPDGYVDVPGKRAIVRTDNYNVLGVVTDHYKPVQNDELKHLVKPLAAEGVLEITNMGELGGGRKVFIQALLPQEYRVIGEEYQAYITLTNCHDGTGAVAIGPTFTRIVCQNTFAMAQKDLGVRFRHSDGVNENVLNTTAVIDFVNGAMRAYADKVEKLATTSCTMAQFEIAAKKILQKDDLTKVRHIDTLNRLFYSGAGNQGKTMYDAFNAWTDLNTHYGRGNADAKFANVNFGLGSRINQRAMAVLSEMAYA